MGTKSGFTLVELMIVVAIIGILAAIALPLYQTYVVRTRMAEAVLALSQCRESVSEIYQMSSAGRVTAADTWDCAENASQTAFVNAVNTDVNGVVIVTVHNIDPVVDGKTVEMVPLHNGVPVTAADIPVHVNGFDCRPGTANGVDPKYLGRGCR